MKIVKLSKKVLFYRIIKKSFDEYLLYKPIIYKIRVILDKQIVPEELVVLDNLFYPNSAYIAD